MIKARFAEAGPRSGSCPGRFVQMPKRSPVSGQRGLYVHLILKPAYAAHGLPIGEVRVGLVSMVIMGITGTLLTIYRIPSFSVLYQTRFGILLLIKIALFLMMLFTAFFVVLILGPKYGLLVEKVPQKAHDLKICRTLF